MADVGEVAAKTNSKLSSQIPASGAWQNLLSEVDKLTADLYHPGKQHRFHCYEHFAIFVTNDHAKAVEETLYDLIYGDAEESLKAAARTFSDVFIPTEEEVMFLCAATRLRCIGLLWGLFVDEERNEPVEPNTIAGFDNTAVKPPNWVRPDGRIDSRVIERLIQTFPSRSACFVREDWKLWCSWGDREKAIVSSILNSYLPTVPESDIPEKIDGVRVRKLAYLLRVATVCSLRKGVCPLEIRLQLKPDSLCDMRKTHLATVNWITKTKFDHSCNTVEFRSLVPSIEKIPDPRNGSSLPIAYVDFGSGLEFLGSIIQDVIDTVSEYLEGCRNTRIRTVRMSSEYAAPEHFRTAESYLPDQWALPVAGALNAAEVAGMTALALRSFCKVDSGVLKISVRDQVAQVCDAVEYMHPCNALTRKLIRKVRSEFRWDSEPDNHKKKVFQNFLTDYLIQRADAGDRVSQEAVRQGALLDASGKALDYVIVYGYSRSVLSTLIAGSFRGTVLLINIDESVRGPWVNHEQDRIQTILDKSSIKFETVPLAALNVKLQRLRGDRETFSFLTGSRCVLRRRRQKDVFLCPVGTWQVATTVNAKSGRTIVFAEEEKTIDDVADLKALDKILENLADEQETRPWVQVDQLTLGTEIKMAIRA